MKKFVIIFVALVFTGFIAKSQTFTDQIAGSGLERVDKIAEIRELFDFNNDGFEDIIYSTKTAAALLYKNNGNGTFSDVSSMTNFPVFSTEVSSIICTDLDNNGFKDVVYYLNHGGNKVNDTLRIFMNYDASFVEKTTAFGIVNPILHGTNHFCTNIMPVDFDKDGDLDILFASTNRTATNACTDSKVAVLENKLNNPTSPSFNTIVELLNFPVNIFPAGLSVTDYNNDQFADIAVCEQSGTKGNFDGYRADPFFLYKNNGNATFTKVAGAGLADASTHNFITVWDYNNDGLLDFLNGTSDCCGTVLNILWKNNGDGTYTDMRSTYNLHPVNDYYGRLSAVDFNNDGNFDISTTGMGGFWSDTRIQLWENNGSTFTNTAATYGLQIGYNGGFKGLGNNSVWFDYDNDGDLDFYSQNWNSGLNYLQSLMKNPNTSLNKYLRIKLVGTFSPKDGTGSRVVLKIGTKKLTQYSNGTIGNNQSDIFHFGVGQNATIDSLCVYWSSGNVTRMANVSANQLLTITEQAANRITDYIQQASRYGSANDQDPAGMYISNGWLYIAGNDAGQSLLMKYPVEDINTPVWSIVWPNVVSGGGEMFTGVTSDENGIYAAGWSYSQTTDNSGGKEIKPVLCKFPLNGATGTGTGGTDWIAKPALFPYQGYEGFNDDILNIEEGIRYIYACGTPQANGNNNTAVLTKYDTNNNLIWKEVMGNTTSGHFNTANSISILNNNVYTAGSSDSHITLWKSDAAGNLTWEKSTEITVNSGLNAICSSGQYLFAAGYEQTTGQGKNVVILKYDENGNVVWKTLWGGSLDDIAHGIEFFDNKVLVVGETSSYGAGGKDAFILQLNAEDGAMNDSVFYGGSLDDIAVKIKKDNNTVYISGSFQGDAAFETFTLHSSGAKDIFILKMKGGENEKVYNITAGSLSTTLTETEKATLTRLKLTGTIDARDFKTMRDSMPMLTEIDLSLTDVLEYTGTEGTNSTSITTYLANSIPQRAFYNATTLTGKINLTHFLFPNLITSIANGAFRGCTSLSSVEIPSTVTQIGNAAFRSCSALETVKIPSSIGALGDYLFNDSGLSSIEIPSSVTSIGTWTFGNCKNLKSINLPSSITTIGNAAFGNSGLKSIDLPNGVTSIGSWAFQVCDSLTSISIPATVNHIGFCAFVFNNALTSFQVANDNALFSSVDGVLFDKNQNKLLYFPGGKGDSYQIPVGVTLVDTAAFEGSYLIKNVIIPSTVTTFSPEVFYFCTNLSSINIPASVTSIGGYSFYNCYNLKTIYANAPTPVDLSASDSVFSWIDKNQCVLYVPAGSKTLYQTANQWKEFVNIVELNYKTVTVAAGGLYPALTSTELSIVTNLKIKGTIDARDFKTMRDSLKSLNEIDLSEVDVVAYTGVGGTIGDGTVLNSYPANMIPRGGLFNKTGLGEIKLPVSITAIGRNSLRNTGIRFINIPENVVVIDTLAFRDCQNLSGVDLPANLKSINYGAFSNCTNLNSLSLQNLSSLAHIGDFAFYFCPLPAKFEIPASVTYIGIVAFIGTKSSIQVALSNQNYESENGILYNKNKTTIFYCPENYTGIFNIPSTVNIIEVDAFYNCFNLSNIILPNSLNVISEWAFENCYGLTSIKIPASVTNIKSYAFYNCNNLQFIIAESTIPVNLSESDSVFNYVNKVNCILFVPVGSKFAYQAAGQWKDFVNIVEGEGAVIYNVTVLVGTKACYIAGEMNNWTQQQMNKVDDTHYSITIQGASVSQLYKYCSGPGWNYVEINTDGSETPNRNYAASDTVVRWASVYDPSTLSGVTYTVTVPNGTKACYIAGQMNNWTQQPMTKIDDTHYTITIQGASVSQLYKYCSGPGWGYVEVNADGSETQDRNYAANDVVVKWASVYDPDIVLTDFVFNVTVPAGTKTCFIAGDMNGWTLQLMTKVDDTHYKITLPSNSVFEYIYFSGPEWEYRELDAMGNYMSRMYAVSDTVARWESLFDPNVVPVSMTYSVTVPAGTKACYIAGRMNDWSFQEMTKVDDTHYIITLSSHPSFGYKYCSGPSWDFVEVNASGDYTTNRNYSANDVVAGWLAVYNPTLIESDWELQTNPDGESVGKIQFVSATEGWIACGSSGNLLHTINGGTTWNVVTPFPDDVAGNMSDPALSMSWVNPTHGWAIKSFTTDTTFNFDIVNGAVIYSTKDGGGNWLKQELPKTSATVSYSMADLQGTWQLHAVTAKNLTDILSVGGWMFGTGTIDASGICSFSISKSNGSIKSPIVPMSISSGGVISVNGDEIGFMSTDKSKIFMTGNEDDNGYSFYVMQKQITEVTYNISDLQGTWQWHSLVSGDLTKWAGWLHGIITLDASGNGTLSNKVKSNGSSDMVSAVSMSINANGVISVGGDSHGYLSADKRSLILTMTDGGGGYTLGFGQKVLPDSTYSTSDLQGRWQTHLITTSNPASSLIQKSGWSHGVINLNSDGEGSLNFVDSDGDFSDDDVSLSISSDGLVTTSGRDIHGFMSADKRSVIMTMSEENGGFTLAAMQKDLSVSGDVGLQIQFVDENVGWASVYNMSTGDLKLYKSTNGGSNWNPMTTHGPIGIFYFVDANNGWSITRYSSDSIKTPEWSISHTTDGGVHWTVQFTDAGNTDYEFNAIQFTDLTHGWVVGHGGKIFKTTNGSDWTAVTNAEISNESNSKSVYFLNANTGWITNEDSSWPAHTILHTTDGGANWTHQDPGFLNGSMFSIFFWDENNGWFTGEQMIGFGTNENFEYDFRGIIGHYKNVDSGLNDSLLKSEITIYPNPAAEGFFIEAGEKTSTVSIYNLNGVITLNKQFTGKTYIDIATLPPGMYIVKVINTEGTLEKKLIRK